VVCRGYQRFGNQGYGYANRFASKRALYVYGAIGTGGVIFYYRSLEEIPYMHRWHAIFIGPDYEKKLGKQTFTQVMIYPAWALHSIWLNYLKRSG
jgi:hypothetical protein